MGGSSSPSSTTQTQKLDPWLKDKIQGNLDTIAGLEQYTPYPTEDAIAPLTPEMQQAQQQMGQLGGMGFGAIGQGLQGLQGVAGTQAQQVSPAELNMGQFQNPWTEQVVDQSLGQLDRARRMAIGRGEDAAIAAGAYGGSRHGVADAETNRAFADQAARTAAQLNAQGFNTALGAAQQQQGLDLAAQQANQGASLDAARLGLLGSQGLLGAGQGLFGQGVQAAQFGQNYEQAMRDFDYQQYQQAFQDPRILAQMETAAIQGIPVIGSTTSTQPGGSRFGGAIGGGLSGAAMGAQVGSVVPGLGTGISAAVGGGLGLLGGMFG